MPLFKIDINGHVAILGASLLIASQEGIAEECDAVLTQASTNYIQHYDIEDQKSFAYHLMCKKQKAVVQVLQSLVWRPSLNKFQRLLTGGLTVNQKT
jgi:hypothetical protein